MSKNEIYNYLNTNLNKFSVSTQELQRMQREEKFSSLESVETYILDFFKKTLKEYKNNKDDIHIFSISENTVVLITGNRYFHVQIFDNETNKEKFIIKSFRKNHDFNIHDYKNQGLTITNHLIDRYMQYFKQLIPWKDKNIHKDEFEKELMIKLKNGKKIFSKELTDTVYMAVDDMYFVLKIRGKNTISLLTMRPFVKILELPKCLKLTFKKQISYTVADKCQFCNEQNSRKQIRIGKDGFKVHDSCLQKKYPNRVKSKLFDKFGELYIQVLEGIPDTYIDNATNTDEWLKGALSYIKDLKLQTIKNEEQSIEDISNNIVHNCIDCKNTIDNEDFYTRIHKEEYIHKVCAHAIIDIKSTEKIFAHSGYKGLKAASIQRAEQEEENRKNAEAQKVTI